jgi:hypothetical protein
MMVLAIMMLVMIVMVMMNGGNSGRASPPSHHLNTGCNIWVVGSCDSLDLRNIDLVYVALTQPRHDVADILFVGSQARHGLYNGVGKDRDHLPAGAPHIDHFAFVVCPLAFNGIE